MATPILTLYWTSVLGFDHPPQLGHLLPLRHVAIVAGENRGEEGNRERKLQDKQTYSPAGYLCFSWVGGTEAELIDGGSLGAIQQQQQLVVEICSAFTIPINHKPED
uniref:Uncharacterized protein n=1 Tax=Leersia perrieri TaxID=77586 RepID=A0A0D9W1F7_9ORYZ